jgi:hypothetical protein
LTALEPPVGIGAQRTIDADVLVSYQPADDRTW